METKIFLVLLFCIIAIQFEYICGHDGGDGDEGDGDDGRSTGEDESKHLVYLTLSPKSEDVQVNMVTNKPNDGHYTVSEAQSGENQEAEFQYTLSNDKNPFGYDADDLGHYSASLPMPKSDGDPIKYKVSSLRPHVTKMVDLDDNEAETNLNVCVFGDYRADLYMSIKMNMSQYIEDNKCNLNLFIGKITWEQRPEGFAFNPYLMLHDNNAEERHVAFSKVPSIFGEVGYNLSETTFFQSTEVNGVAFIQTTVTLVTLANITYGTEQFDKVEEYFRETMLNELECKLQELYRRDNKPWIVVFLTHPSLFKDRQVNWLMLNSVDRFFEILKRYKIDLLTSCGIEGMSQILKDRAATHPDEQLPAYLQTTMAECGNYVAFAPGLQNECSYAVLNINKDTMTYTKKDLDAKELSTGTIEKNTQEPDQCVEHEL
ncbi:hypothetical protein DdX_18155 [Ditylenchus destructor]|uniref:Uncharacterized protein n=1 Tax=Ditylenchus destructor TaxID=166010 RepID=A0AAD4MQ16_9BILA|nr:hypothetical protein DdX_18155 [Ditylenchus destructor]